ncbi:uncharacterized protein LOC132714219 isoform X2 [Ruditapes philippinarum]|uniref:uncharacterized protein LOC132714219 isoform X2 n=1 Tax=Ruditapes philippinarum TaxID=129788 RepID=UPI00295A92D3|nr:uncharacterized protein LOC132714219 isoform X2 [Ruditapes philippinarum]
MFKKFKIHIHIFGTLLIVLDGSWGYTRMEDYCSNEISFIAYTVYQTQLQLTDNNLFEKRNPNHPYDRLGYCETTVKGWYTSFNKLMFYFEDINLDCDKGHLEFYAGERSFARIEESCPSYGHECDNSRCIDKQLVCNGYDSCGDGSGCVTRTRSVTGIVIGITVGVVLVICLFVCCLYFIRRSNGAADTVQNTSSTVQTATYVNHESSSQPLSGSIVPPIMTTDPIAAQNHVTNQDNYQQGSIRPIYGLNEGTNNQSNRAPGVSHPNTSEYIDPSASPPSYDEVMAKSEIK